MPWREGATRAMAAAVLATALTAGGCNPLPPTLTLSDVGLASIGPDGVGVVLEFQASNPNPFPVTVKSVLAELTSGGALLGEALAVEPIPVLPARKTAEVSAKARLAFPVLLAAAGKLGRERSLDYRLSGRFVFDLAGVDLSVPVESSGRMALVEMLRWQFKRADVFVGGDKPVTLVFDVTNPNAFAVPMAALAGEVTVGGQPLVTAETSAVTQIAAGATVEVSVAVALKKEGFAKVLEASRGQAKLDFQPRVRLVRPISLIPKAVIVK